MLTHLITVIQLRFCIKNHEYQAKIKGKVVNNDFQIRQSFSFCGIYLFFI